MKEKKDIFYRAFCINYIVPILFKEEKSEKKKTKKKTNGQQEIH